MDAVGSELRQGEDELVVASLRSQLTTSVILDGRIFMDRGVLITRASASRRRLDRNHLQPRHRHIALGTKAPVTFEEQVLTAAQAANPMPRNRVNPTSQAGSDQAPRHAAPLTGSTIPVPSNWKGRGGAWTANSSAELPVM
jgi:hypothetical protein